MPTKTLAALPVDGRPVVRQLPQQLAELADWTLLCPEVDTLGFMRQGADRDVLRGWLLQHASRVDGFVLSLDMLVYGGLVPSRFIEDSEAELLERLAFVRELKQRYPDKPIYAFSATMRISNNNYNEEEKLYWADYGSLLWQWSFHSHRFELTGDKTSRRLRDEAAAQIPEVIRADYRATRARNFAVNLAAVELAEQGIIDRLVFPQDDTAEYGFNIAERMQLEARCAALVETGQVAIYPGADEVLSTLLCHLLLRQERAPAPRFAVSYSSQQGARVKARYEDRALAQSIACQIAACGGKQTEQPEAADILLGAHVPLEQQGEWALQQALEQPTRLLGPWLSQLARQAEQGRIVGVVDLVYANGGDPALVPQMLRQIPCNRLAAYAGWNTAGNTIGTAVAQLALWQISGRQNRSQQQLLLATRLLDDWLYQADLRQKLRAQIDETRCTPDALLSAARDVYLEPARQWLTEQRLPLALEDIYQPWARTFEIGLNLVEKEACA